MAGGGEEEEYRRRLAREDVLRYLGERGGEAGLDEVVGEVGDEAEALGAVRELEGEGLLERVGDRVRLTGRGAEEAWRLVERHREAERILEEAGLLSGDEAHRAAHSLEHLGVDVERVLEEARGARVESLYSLRPGDTGRILAVLEPRPSILARLFGVGVLPGRRVRVVAKSRGLLILETGMEARLAALDSSIARRILVVRGR